MKIVFVSVGTSLLDRGDRLGDANALRLLRQPAALQAWRAAADHGSPELAAEEAETRLWAAIGALEASADAAALVILWQAADRQPERISKLRAAFAVAGPEAELSGLPAELASLALLLSDYLLDAEDWLVLLASDSPQGALVGLELGAVLDNHPALGGATVKVVWPRGWQPHDAETLENQGAARLLATVDHLLGARPLARPLFVVTGGLKLGIAVLTQVSCWHHVDDHDGLFFKLDDPGSLSFPPCRFVEQAEGHILLPRFPTTLGRRAAVPATELLRSIVERATTAPWPRARTPRTTLIVTVGAGLTGQKSLLTARFGSSRLADPEVWQPLHDFWRCRTWAELRQLAPSVPTDAELLAAIDPVVSQFTSAWDAGATRELPAELASLRTLWSAENSREPLLRGPLRILLLATDTLAGELCASFVEEFLSGILGDGQVETKAAPGSHPYRSEPGESDRFSGVAELVAEAARDAERLLFLPLGGTKPHVPLLTVLASRLQAPILLGHEGLDRPVLVPWLEADGHGVRAAAQLDGRWPELANFPILDLGGRG